MKTFLTEAERERIRDAHISGAKRVLDVFNQDSINLEKTMETQVKSCEYGIDILDVALGNLALPELAEQPNRENLVQLIAKWCSKPQIDFSMAAMYLEIELGLGKTSTVEQRIKMASEKISMAEGLLEIGAKFPYLLMEHQYNNILNSDAEELKSLRKQSLFLDNLALDDIAQANIDFAEMRELNKYYTPFSPTLLTLQQIEEMELAKDRLFFPIINSNFPGRKAHGFKGVVETIPKDVFEAITTLDPRVYEYGNLGIQIKNFLTTAIMSGERNYNSTIAICGLIKKGDYKEIQFEIDRNMLVNVGLMLNYKELLSNDTRQQAENLMNPKKAVQASLRKTAREVYLPITESALEQAASELSSTGFTVSFRYMRNEQNHADINNIPEAKNPGLLLIDIKEYYSFFMNLLEIYIKNIDEDLQSVLTQGPRLMPNGSKFYHENKAFFEAFKADPNNVDIFKQVEIVEKIAEKIQHKGFKEFINTTLEGIKWGNEELKQGKPNSDVMHYLSSRYPNKVIIEKINQAGKGDLLLGYGMHNCLKTMDLIRYHSNPDARIYCFWLDGIKVGMSYDVMVQGFDNEYKNPLIDSIELNEHYSKTMQKFYRNKDGTPALESDVTGMLVELYLKIRAQHSETGIYVLPESNNFHVKEAMQKFIKNNNGKPVLGYKGSRVSTDTDFKGMPYWVDKSEITSKIYNVILSSDGEVLVPGEGRITSHQLTDEANEHLKSQLKMIIEQ